MTKTESWLWRCPAGTTKQIDGLKLEGKRSEAVHFLVALGIKALREQREQRRIVEQVIDSRPDLFPSVTKRAGGGYMFSMADEEASAYAIQNAIHAAESAKLKEQLAARANKLELHGALKAISSEVKALKAEEQPISSDTLCSVAGNPFEGITK